MPLHASQLGIKLLKLQSIFFLLLFIFYYINFISFFYIIIIFSM